MQSPVDITTLGAVAVILFGSRAAECHGEDSDWDLLCVGDGEYSKKDGVEIVWITEEETRTHRWIGSELANHVAVYGKVLLGEMTWKPVFGRHEESIEFKRARIQATIGALDRVFVNDRLDIPNRELLKLRRDLQRLEILEAGGVVPPGPMLDRNENI